MSDDPWLLKYRYHRKDAGRRSIPFLLTYEEWLKIWVDSGHLHERGCYKGQYNMARYGDVGPYAVGNVRIVTVLENQQEKWARSDYREMMVEISKGKKSPEARRKLSVSRTGMTASPETRRKMSQSRMGNQNALGNLNFLGRKHAQETKDKLRAINLGKTPTAETRAKMSVARLGNQHALGHRHSEESRAKMRAGHKARSERKRRAARRQRILNYIRADMAAPLAMRLAA